MTLVMVIDITVKRDPEDLLPEVYTHSTVGHIAVIAVLALQLALISITVHVEEKGRKNQSGVDVDIVVSVVMIIQAIIQ